MNCRFTETLGPKLDKYVRVNDAIILNTEQVQKLLDWKSEDIVKYITEIAKNETYRRILFILNVSMSGGNSANHWICIEVNRKNRTLNVYDSLLENLDECKTTPDKCAYYTTLEETLKLWVAVRYKITFKDCTQQNNGYDCGLFAMDALKARAFEHDIVRTVTREGLKKLANLQPCFVCGLFKAIVWPVYSNVSTEFDDDKIFEVNVVESKKDIGLGDLGTSDIVEVNVVEPNRDTGLESRGSSDPKPPTLSKQTGN